MAYEQLRETCFFKTGRKGVVLEFLDEMYPNEFNWNKSVSNDIFKKYSKVKVTLVDSRKTSGKGNAVFYNLDPAEILLLTYLLSDGNPEAFKKRVGAFNAFSQVEQLFVKRITETFDRIDFTRFDQVLQEKVGTPGTSVTFQKNINTSADNLLIRKFSLSYEEAMRNASKWKVTIEEGVGKKDVDKGNGLNIVKSGTFKSTMKTSLNVQVEEIVLPINEASKRVMAGMTSFYPVMKAAEVDFTARKFEAKDFNGDNIDEWNPQGKVVFKQKEEPAQTEAPAPAKSEAKPAEAPKPEGKDACSDCGVDIPANVKSYSTKVLGRALCFNCQKKARETAS